MQGFRKVDPDRWEFANEYFLRGRRDLLSEIHRRKPAASERGRSAHAQSHVHEHAAIEVGHYGGLLEEVDSLKRDKTLLMQEVVRLRHAQQLADEDLRNLNDRLELTEQRQQQMIAFFAQAMQHPALVQHFLATAPSVKRLEDGRRRKKRRAPAPGAPNTVTTVSSESEGSDVEKPAPDAMIVHPSSTPAAQGLADLAQAFMSLLNTSPPPKPARRPAVTTTGPIIEEAAPGSSADLPFAGMDGAPMMIGSTPIVLDASALAPGGSGNLNTAGGDLNTGMQFVPLDNTMIPTTATMASPIVEFPGLDSGDGTLNLDDLDLSSVMPDDLMTMPSQDLLITDSGAMNMNEGWNSLVHPPAGTALLPSEYPGDDQK